MTRSKRLLTGFTSLLVGLLLVVAPNARALELVVSDNGSGSDNEITTQVETTTTVEQSNTADVSNNVETSSDTGGNEASGNTGGDADIETGDARVQVTVENSLNSSEVEVGCCPQDTSVEISGNASDSQNKIDLTRTNETNISVNQEAKVSNKVDGSANTGENTGNDNSGNVSIQTGDIRVSGGVQNGPINVSDVSGASGWGELIASITGNGTGSTNSISATFSNNTNVLTDYLANIFNKIFWDLNTGGNSANGNNGDVSIVTGDIFFDFFIKNGPINIGGVDISCCDIFDPGEPPEEGEEEEEEEGGEEEEEEEEEEEGELLPAAAAAEAGGPGVVGLSDTSSEAARVIFFWAGLLMLAAGAYLLGSEAKNKLPKRRNG